MKVIPLGSRLLIKPIKEERKTEGGIVLPDTAKEKPMKAEVIEVGKDVEDLDIKAGDKVIFSKYAGTEIKIDDEDYIVIDQDDILAKIED
ncbi:MAG: co-chaperone GroES [Thermotogae bacterium]|uniref:Co-chaperonin GroES n=2 Tax=Kosmotoga arenicorallina TaxID=688066 RepID=A0A176K234_9BACT|nr:MULTISPECIES: co-chaperone GroES [Kosmotoga]RKX49914.1 MAG: co-chaperone GroES [Thermotogota bacterium]HHF08703.1 co-chaperone GroES [Kosmotoga arenicorallina]MBO8165896.1 co-chaperone GroES [Kosmotoga sp.]MCD6159635.1 co-chaperone GroES [Kosmotoga sp.]OAA31080.1 molecular chaperone GroES [Kosmotoga arenicorallina S304]